MSKPSPHQITLDELIALQEDSPVNPFHTPASEREQQMTVTSGRRCLTLSEPLNPVGSWGRTFSELLVGQMGWYSSKCALTWNLKGTPFNRLYYQLRPLTRPTSEIAYGLLPTPMAQTREVTEEQVKARQEKYGGTRRAMYLDHFATMGMLPTPTTQEPCTPCEVTAAGRRKMKNGSGSHSLNLGRAVALLPTPTTDERDTKYQQGGTNLRAAVKGMLPTPLSQGLKVSDENGKTKFIDPGLLPMPKAQESRGNASKDRGKANLTDEIAARYRPDSSSSQLNPRFVAEMMGFPVNWTELPFLSGEQKA